MTIKKIGLSIAAVAMLGTASFAGTVTNPGSVGLIGQEKLSLSDVNISAVFGTTASTSTGNGIVYTPTDIPATSLKNPIFKFTFANGKDVVASSTTAVFEAQDGNATNATPTNYKLVAKTPQISGTNSNIISFNAVDSNTYAYNSKKYVVADSNGTDVNGTAAVQLTVVKGSSSDLTLQAELYSGDSQAQADIAPATSIAKVGAEYTGSVSTEFNARIDASNSFYTFYDQGTTSTADTAVFNLHQNATLTGASLGVTAGNIVVTFDQNLTKNAYTAAYTGTVTSASPTRNDNNVTDSLAALFNTSNNAQDNNETLTLVVDGASTINKTNFDVHAYVTSGTTNFDVISKTTGNAGAWTVYGYNAQIPNVAGKTGNFETVFEFANRSSIPADVFFTLIDPKGTIVTLSSVDNSADIASLPADNSSKYKATKLAALAMAKDPSFLGNGYFNVEVSIPTTPSSVYGSASFLNSGSGQFKDLPVYNTGNNY
jgi:hypothetical protein